MTPHPIMRVRYIRWRLIRMLEDARSARLVAEQASDQLSEMRGDLAQSHRHAAALEAAHARMEVELRNGLLEQREMHDALSHMRSELDRQGRVLELLYEEESENLRKLGQLRRSSSYIDAFTDPEPLVSVIIPTYLQHELLLTRAIPSALEQTYDHIEVVVVGDGAPEATAQALETLNDPRVRYENLTVRAPYPEDPVEFWRVAGTPPWNAAWELATGAWIAPLNDDDAFHPRHIEMLLSAARDASSEVAYGAVEHHHPDGTSEVVNSWPPESHHFGWQAALIHAGLGFMPMQLGAGPLGVPGDWSLCRRMRRAGVSFTKVDDVVVDYYPSGLWRAEQASRES
jgi:hypothetical protein